MADIATVRLWLQQGRADLDAASVTTAGSKECHSRYWYQQACEKGIKALGMIVWNGPASEEGQFRALFLHRHDPLKRLQQGTTLPHSLRVLLRQIEGELQSIDNSGLLLRIDATTASLNPTDTSYRYPFIDSTGTAVAPALWTTADWDAYQGNEMGVRTAVRRLLDRVEKRIKEDRGPK